MKDVSAPFPLRLAEELILLMLDEKTGYLEMVPGWTFSCVMAGAVLADLAFEGSLDTDPEALYLVNSDPTGDNLLDPTLKDVAASDAVHDTQYWIERNTGRSDEIVTFALDRLVERKILDHESGGFWGLSRAVSRSGAYPASDLQVRREANTRIISVILDDDSIPDPRDAILIALMHAFGGFRQLLEPEDYEERLERIDFVANLDLIGRTVATAVKNSAATPRTRRAVQAKPVPKLGYFDILRQPGFLGGNISKGMYGILQKHGPVVELPFKMRKTRTIALMGHEVNQWVNKHGRFYLRTKDYIKDFEGVFGASRTMPGMDGAEHYRLRKELKSGYSRATAAAQLPELIRHCRESMGRWREGDVFGATKTFYNHVAIQISHLMIGVDCSDYVDEVLAYEFRALNTHIQGAFPKFMLSTPRMKRYKKRIAQLQEEILASHTPAQRKGKPRDFADVLLELHKNDPQFMPETDITFPLIATISAAVYLGNALSFCVYCMLRHPDVYARVREEAEGFFGNGREPAAEEFTRERIDVTHRLYMECSRLYPVIPMQLRTVMNECIVSGYQIPSNTLLLIASSAPHYNETLFKDPEQFDIDRYLPDRAEHLHSGAYAPFGLGTHTCLGQRWVELQMAVNILLIAYHIDLKMASPDYKLRINPFPKAAPNKKFNIRVAGVTNPL